MKIRDYEDEENILKIESEELQKAHFIKKNADQRRAQIKAKKDAKRIPWDEKAFARQVVDQFLTDIA